MSDRFKFRVWDKSLKKYMEFKEFKFMNVEFTFNPITKEAEIEYDKERYDVEQCTGLKDKNGKLIYEGDILFVKTLDWKNKERWNAGEVRTYWSVEYKDYWNHRGFMVFGINRRFHKPLTRTTIFNSEAVIVGNIHKNPELLKESK